MNDIEEDKEVEEMRESKATDCSRFKLVLEFVQVWLNNVTAFGD